MGTAIKCILIDLGHPLGDVCLLQIFTFVECIFPDLRRARRDLYVFDVARVAAPRAADVVRDLRHPFREHYFLQGCTS